MALSVYYIVLRRMGWSSMKYNHFRMCSHSCQYPRVHRPSIKRIVVTSSTAAILEARPNPVVLSELDWNNQAVREVEEKGRDAHPFMKYRASKTLAERGEPENDEIRRNSTNFSMLAAWDFHATNKDKISWDLTVILPPYVRSPTCVPRRSIS